MPLQVRTRADDADKHANDVNALIYRNGKLYSGADDGKIKIWEEDLKFVAETQAHPSSVFSLAASNDTLYSCSNDGTVKAWELGTLKEKGTIIVGQDEFWKVKFVDGKLYVGDNQGGLRVYENNQLLVEENTCDPIKDLSVSGNYVFTVRDLDVIVTELKPGDKWVATTKKTVMGKSPVAVIGNEVVFASRTGKDILVYEISNELKPLAELKDAHEMIINSIAGVPSGSGALLYSGGWDRVVKQWKIEAGKITPIDKVTVDIVVNVLTNGEKGEVYAAGSDGHIVRVDV